MARVLGLEVLRAVLADDLDPGFGERGQVVHADVLGRCDDGDVRAKLGPDPVIVLADRLSR